MLALKKPVMFYIIVSIFMLFLFSPVRGDCATLTGRLLEPGGGKVSNVHVFLYEWNLVQQQGGLFPSPHSGQTDSDGYIRFTKNGNLGIGNLSENVEYLLIFSTRALVTTKVYPSFYYGAQEAANQTNPSKYVKVTRVDPFEAPRIKINKSDFDLGTLYFPTTGVFLFGYVKDKTTGNHIPDVRVELFQYTDSGPAPMPFPFYCFDTTDGPFTMGSMSYNFSIGGIVKGTDYAIKVIGNHKGYIDAFYMEGSSDQVRKFNLSGNDNAGDIRLVKGGTIKGNIKNQSGQNVTDSTVLIQAISFKGQQRQANNYVIVTDPNVWKLYEIYKDADAQSQVKWLRYYQTYIPVPPNIILASFNDFYYKTDGYFELKGLPYEGQYYVLKFTELSSMTIKKFATPVYYNAGVTGKGVYYEDEAQHITLSASQNTLSVTFNLKEGNCFGGDITLNAISDNAQSKINSVISSIDPNLDIEMITDPYISFEVYRLDEKNQPVFQDRGQSYIDAWTSGTGNGFYDLCGFPPGDYTIFASAAPLYPYMFEAISLNTFGEIIYTKDIHLPIGGMVEGQMLKKSDSNLYEPLQEQVPVYFTLVDPENSIVGSYFKNTDGNVMYRYPVITDSSGKFCNFGLPLGHYTVGTSWIITDTATAYMPQIYNPDETNGVMVPNHGRLVEVEGDNPDFVAIGDMKLIKAGVESGGVISGYISLSTDPANLLSLSDDSFYLRLFNADTGIENYRHQPVTDPNNIVDNKLPYHVFVESDGDYVMAVHDTGGKVLPHYYQSSTQSTADKNSATSLAINATHRSLTNINFKIQYKGWKVTGQVLNASNQGVPDLQINAWQKVIKGPNKGIWTYYSNKTTTTGSDGKFTLEGLFLGTYVFSVFDPDSVYANTFYHPTQVIFEPDAAFTWNTTSPDPAITIRLKTAAGISGSVNHVSETQVDAFLVKDGKLTDQSYSVIVYPEEPDFKISGVKPGHYIISYRDLSGEYVPMYYKAGGNTSDPDLIDPAGILVSAQTTKDLGTLSFVQMAAKIEGSASGSTSLSNIRIFLHRISGKSRILTSDPELRSAVSDSNGGFSIKGLSKGYYKLVAFGSKIDPVPPVTKVFKINQDQLGQTLPINIVFPSNLDDVKFAKTIKWEKGLNLTAYPTRNPPSAYSSYLFLNDIESAGKPMGMSLRAYYPSDQIWRTASYGNNVSEGTQITSVSGNSFYLRNGQGFMLYAQEEQSIKFDYYYGQTSLRLFKGLNLVGNIPVHPNTADVNEPDLISDTNFTTRKMLAKIGEDASASIQTFNAKAGKWQATYWMWGRSAGAGEKVEDEKGYLVSMKKDLEDWWYPKKEN